MKIVAVIQARYGSARFPGKVLESIGGHTVLEHVVKRVQMAVPDVIVAVPNTSGGDGRIFDLARSRLRVKAYMHDGPEEDVLSRFVAVAVEESADVIVRVTADCPFNDPGMISTCVEAQLRTGADYVSNLPHGYAPQVDGLDCEVFSREALLAADKCFDIDPFSREHVTFWMRRSLTHRVTVERTLPLPGVRQHRWTLDTMSDLEWMQAIAEALDVAQPPAPMVWDLVNYLRANPHMCRYSENEPARSKVPA